MVHYHCDYCNTQAEKEGVERGGGKRKEKKEENLNAVQDWKRSTKRRMEREGVGVEGIEHKEIPLSQSSLPPFLQQYRHGMGR